jgi:hypothetical protein
MRSVSSELEMKIVSLIKSECGTVCLDALMLVKLVIVSGVVFASKLVAMFKVIYVCFHKRFSL